ncbi:MAG: sugar ABC transporter ATP-binding protein, partial [Actinobacteria bacterium]|nr:sugar ABC transporter ATP-binding protein [Actinomycetota bacterium]
ADNGLAVIVISHNLNDVFQVADNIAAMYLGSMAAQVDKNSVNQNDVVRLITTGAQK